MPEKVTFEDPAGEGAPIILERFEIPDDLPDRDLRLRKVPEPDPHYVDLGMLYRFAQLEQARQSGAEGLIPLHVAVRGHMGTGKDHDIEQFAAAMGLPYFRIPLTGEVRDVTLIGSTRLHGDGKGGTESKWEDGDITRALRGPALLNLSELNAAGAETLFALHGLLDRYAALDLPNGETVRLRDDVAQHGGQIRLRRLRRVGERPVWRAAEDDRLAPEMLQQRLAQHAPGAVVGVEQHAEALAADALDVADVFDEAEVSGRRVLKGFDLGRRRSDRSLTGGCGG